MEFSLFAASSLLYCGVAWIRFKLEGTSSFIAAWILVGLGAFIFAGLWNGGITTTLYASPAPTLTQEISSTSCVGLTCSTSTNSSNGYDFSGVIQVNNQDLTILALGFIFILYALYCIAMESLLWMGLNASK